MRWSRNFSWILFILGALIFLSSLLPPLFSWYWSWLYRPLNLFDPEATSIYPIPKFLTEKGLYADIPMSDPKSWFTNAPEASGSATQFSTFLLSFPSLKINNIEVAINGTNLLIHPIHYPGTSLPGEIGNTVILGHSALPQFYFISHKMTVFNPLLKLKLGDSVRIDYSGPPLFYQINKIFEVKPDQIEVFNQPTDRRQLTLITCTPLGTYFRRYVVIADLVE